MIKQSVGGIKTAKCMIHQIKKGKHKMFDDDDYCYECRGYGDDYSYDPDTDEDICNCETCPYNPVFRDDDSVWDD